MTSSTASAPARTGTKGVARPEREAQIVEAGCRVFGERGYAETSVADVARAAGISKPLIYHYFGSRDGLHVACVRRASAALTGEIERSAASGTVGFVRAAVTLDGMFHLLEEQPWLWRVVFDPTIPRHAGASAWIAEHERRIVDFGREGVAALMHEAGNDDPLDIDAMRAAWESVFRALVTWWLDHPGESPATMTQRCVRIFGIVFGELDLAGHLADDLADDSEGSTR